MANLKKIIYLSEAQKNELFAQGSITSNNRTITYNENDIYVTPDKSIDTIWLNGTTYTSNNGTVNLGTTLVDDSNYVVNSLVAPVEETSTASQLYNVGDLFIYNKQLYRATSTIATATTITPNTNCEALQLIEYIEEKANVNNPVFTGAISLGRNSNTTVGTNSVAIGYDCAATQYATYSVGVSNTASGFAALAEGSATTASGTASHSEGAATTASGINSHAEGMQTQANGMYSHTSGLGTIANHLNANVFGAYNVTDPSTANTSSKGTYIEIIGNGTANNSRSNAYALTWTGDGRYAGNLYVGCNTDSTGGNKVATELYVSTAISNIIIPTKVSDLTNDSGFLTSVTAADIPMSSSDATLTSTAITDLRDDLGIVENGTTATHTISTGQYVIWNGSLYTADATIAGGETLASTGGSKNLTAVSNGGFNLLNGHINGKKYLSGRDYVTVGSNWGSWGSLYTGEFTVDISFNNFFTTVESVIVTPNNTEYAAMVSKVTHTNEKITTIGFIRPTQPVSGNKIYFSWLAIGT